MIESYRRCSRKESAQLPIVKFKTNFTNCILQALKRRGFRQTDGQDWDLFWSEKDNIADLYETRRLLPQQKINHFRNYFEVCRKDLLIRNLKKCKKGLEREGRLEESQQYNFFPVTYRLPDEYVIFADEFKRQQSDKSVWIMKPIARSQGKGIFLFNRLCSVSAWEQNNAENYIVQRYIADPLLVGNKKFDMRIYVLVTSYQPLTIYLYRSGFGRFTHYRYEEGKLNQTEIHLTNVAVQKHTDNYDEQLGGKWMLNRMRLYFISKYGFDRVNVCFGRIQELIIKTMEAVQKVMHTDRNHSFELYGFDVLLDSQFQPWLLEVNGSPSMTANTPVDFELKVGLLDDVLSIVDFEKLLTGKEEQVGGFDLIYRGQPVKLPPPTTNKSLLGTRNNRMQNIKKLAKAAAARPVTELNRDFDKKLGTTVSDSCQVSTTSSNGVRRHVPRKVLQSGGCNTAAVGIRRMPNVKPRKRETENRGAGEPI